jgi:hypothetical protein
MTDNTITATEFRDIAAVADGLTELFTKLRTRASSVDFDNVQVYDENGDELVVLVYNGDAGGFVATSGVITE